MSSPTKLLPVSAFTRKNANIWDNCLQVSNYQADSIVSCEVLNLVSFDCQKSNDRPIPTLQTSAGEMTLPQMGRAQHTYRFDPPYTRLVKISLLANRVNGPANENMVEFFNFQALA